MQTDPIPHGFCHCGCGQRTNLARTSSRSAGRVKGQPMRFLNHHHKRVRRRFEERPGPLDTPCHIATVGRGVGDGNYAGTYVKGKFMLAHRVAYKAVYGPIAPGMQLDHLCRVGLCVNPEHLEPVTNAENARRGNQAKLTHDQIPAIRAMVAEGTSHREAGQAFGVATATVHSIISGRSWVGV
jgi:hypothetical protein